MRVVVESPAQPLGCRTCGVIVYRRGRDEVVLVDVGRSARRATVTSRWVRSRPSRATSASSGCVEPARPDPGPTVDGRAVTTAAQRPKDSVAGCPVGLPGDD